MSLRVLRTSSFPMARFVGWYKVAFLTSGEVARHDSGAEEHSNRSYRSMVSGGEGTGAVKDGSGVHGNILLPRCVTETGGW